MDSDPNNDDSVKRKPGFLNGLPFGARNKAFYSRLQHIRRRFAGGERVLGNLDLAEGRDTCEDSCNRCDNDCCSERDWKTPKGVHDDPKSGDDQTGSDPTPQSKPKRFKIMEAVIPSRSATPNWKRSVVCCSLE